MPEDLLELEIETPEELETPETPVEGAEGEQPQGENADGEQKPPITSLFQADGKKFDPQVSSILSKIKGENPEAGKLLMRALNRVGELDREFPGGLNEVREMRDKIEELGGVPGIEEKLQGAAEMDTIAQQFMGADPAFVDDLIESSPEAFNALAPVVFAKYAEQNPDGFQGYIGRLVFGNMQEAGIPLLLMRIGDLVADKPQATEALKQLNDYLGGFKAMAQKPVAEAKPGKTAPQPKKDDLSVREERLRSQEWNAERTAIQKNIVNGEYKKSLNGRTATSEERAQIQELFLSRSAKAADRIFPGWQQKAERYIKSNDKTGYIRYMETIYRRIVPEAVASAVSSTMRGKAAGTQQKPQAPQQKPGSPAARAPEGFTPVAKEPGTWEIDYGRTSQAMLRQNQAVLKDGKKVAWR